MQSTFTSASKRRASSPSPYEVSSKRARTGSPSPDNSSSSSSNWQSVRSRFWLLDQQTSPSSSFLTPPDTCELGSSSPFSIRKHVDSSSPIFDIQSPDQFFPALASSGESDGLPSSENLPKTPCHGPSPSFSIVTRTQSANETPRKEECQPTCFCRLERDSFGKPRRIDIEQLPHKRPVFTPLIASSGLKDANIRRMLVPRSSWPRYRVNAHPLKIRRQSLVVYRGEDNSGVVVTIMGEDLWDDEKNPFLLTKFDLPDSPRAMNTSKDVTSPAISLSKKLAVPSFRHSKIGLGMFFSKFA